MGVLGLSCSGVPATTVMQPGCNKKLCKDQKRNLSLFETTTIFFAPKKLEKQFKIQCTLILNSESSMFATQTYVRTIDEIFVYFYSC